MRQPQFDDYLINYMLDWETKDSDTFLNVEKLASPFDYRLQVTQDGQTEDKPLALPETFNYLLGLHVKTRKVCHDKERRYLVQGPGSC
jgi:adenine-specific DNA-methyltransferase